MKIWQEMLERMRNGDPTEEVRRSCRSASQFQKSIGIFNEEISRKAEEARRASIEEQERLSESKAIHARVLAETELLQKDVHSLSEEKASLLVELHREQETINELREDAKDLERKGYLPKVIGEIKKFQAKNGAEAIELLQDLDKAVALQGKVQTLSVKEAELICSIRSLDKTKQETDKKLLMAKNDLILKKTECAVTEKRLEQLNLVEREAETRLEQLNSFHFRSLQENVSKSKEILESISVQVKKEVNAVISEMADKTRFANEALAVSMYERGKLEEFKSNVEPIFVLLDISTDARLAEKVSSSFVISVLEKVALWLEQRFPDSATGTAYDYLACDFTANIAVMPIKSVAFVRWTITRVRDLMVKESQGKQQMEEK